MWVDQQIDAKSGSNRGTFIGLKRTRLGSVVFLPPLVVTTHRRANTCTTWARNVEREINAMAVQLGVEGHNEDN